MLESNLAYEASAGSGKTFMLVVRYLSLLFLDKNPSKIVALTFTNKAAFEMSDRIITTLKELESKDELKEIAKVTGFTEAELLKKRDFILERFLGSSTNITTIDSFFTKILRKFSLYASLMPDFSLQNSLDKTKLLLVFLQELKRAKKFDTLISVSLESQKRLEDTFALLEELYIKSHELEEIRFSKSDIKKYEDEALASLAKLRDIVFECSEASGKAKSGVDGDTIAELLKKSWLSRDTLEYVIFKKCYKPEMDEYLKVIKRALKNYTKAKESNFFASLLELLDIYKESKKKLYMEDSKLSFADMTHLVHMLLTKLDDRDFLYFRLDSHIEHILLDEFQDTSIVQYEVLKPLIEEIVSGIGAKEDRSFFFVGDTKQAIYRFRGGVSELFDVVLYEQGSTLKKLTTNYRSCERVVEFVNSTFKTKIANYTPQTPSKKGGYVELKMADEPLDEVVLMVKKLKAKGYRDIAVLCVNNDDGDAIKFALEESRFEVLNETTSKLINQKPIKAIVEYLKFLYFNEDIYKENFLALLALKSADIKLFDFSSTSLFEIVKDVIKEYKLADFNTIKFLAKLTTIGDIEELLYELDSIDESVASTLSDGIKVLTIHKSKGLEYDATIVMDRLKKPPPNRDMVIYDYDGIYLKNLYLRQKNRDELDGEYADVLAKEAALSRVDRLNAQYVAFTRAREALCVVYKQKDSYFDTLELDEQICGELLEKKDEAKESKIYEKLEFNEQFYGQQKLKVKEQGDDELDFKTLSFGLALHYVLESLSSFSLDELDSAISMMKNRFAHTLEEGDINDIKKRVTMLLQNSEFLTLVDGECFREKLIKKADELRYIDLLVKKDNGYIVIDYKSSELFSHKHKEQVCEYVDVLKSYGLEVIGGYICYLLKDKITIKSIG
ncbi:MAG: RecB-like helicase [Sulfurimonadaceae bacterium]|jgi:exodeoxyribonuclease V beta subunit|nr:RecB-like helicase [Sulfurimonadaceae bacterium]